VGKLIDILALLLVKALVFIIGNLPDPLGLKLSRVVVNLIPLLMSRVNKAGIRNLELVFPEKTNSERKKILEESYQILALNLFYFCKIGKLNKDQLLKNVDFSEAEKALEILRAHGPITNVIYPTLHFGCFELLAQIWCLEGYPISILARGFGLPKVDAWWNRRREVYGNSVFSRNGGFAEIVKRLNEGKSITLLFDQNVKLNHAIFVELFGIKAATTKTVALANLRTGAPIIFTTSAYLGNGKFKVIAKNVTDFRSRTDLSKEEKIYQITKELHEHTEEAIKAYPDHWFWIHRRYKTRPQGEKENLYD
jgi:Kdo2-lipid IVA lauroyltransferase/acyltransferase